MASIYVKSGGGAIGSGSYRGVWVAGSTWAVGDRIVAANVISYRVMECTTGGAGGAGAEPTWNTTTGGTTTDNAAVWTTRLPDTWANATVDLTRAAANDAAGDTIYVSHQHAESTAAAVSLAWAGSAASPTRILCVNDGAEPPTTLATSATVTTTGNSTISVHSVGNQYSYVYGISFIAGSGASGTATINVNGQSIYEGCSFQLATTGSSSRITIGDANSPTRAVNCTFKFANASQAINAGTVGNEIVGGSLLSGGTSPTNLFSANSSTQISFSGFDLSNASAGINLVTTAATSRQTFRNCKLPASWSGSLHSGTPGRGHVVELFNSDSGDTNYRYRKATEFGTIQDETTLVRTGGSTDGDTPIAWKLVTNANAEHPMLTLDSMPITKRINTVGSPVTLKAQILHDSVTNLTDAEVWMEVQYLGTSGVPLGSFVSDGVSVVATPADQASSSVTWTTTGMANPNKQELSVTFTPQEKGFAVVTVRVAKASYTLYLCGEIDQS